MGCAWSAGSRGPQPPRLLYCRLQTEHSHLKEFVDLRKLTKLIKSGRLAPLYPHELSAAQHADGGEVGTQLPPTAALAAQQLPGPCLWLVHASSRLSGPGVLEMHLSICQTVQQGAACHMHPHRCPCCCNSPVHACAGVPHLHGHLSQHEHSLLLQRPGVHGVFCVPPDLVRPAWPGTVPLLQDHALCRAGGWVGGWEGHCCGCGNLKPPLRRHVLQASHQSAVACMAVRAGTTPILDQPHCAAVLCSTTVPWHQAERATSKRAGGGGGLEASQAAAQGAAGEQYSRKSTLVGSQHENAHGCSQSWCHTHGDTPGCVVHSCIADTVQHPQALCVLGAAFPPPPIASRAHCPAGNCHHTPGVCALRVSRQVVGPQPQAPCCHCCHSARLHHAGHAGGLRPCWLDQYSCQQCSSRCQRRQSLVLAAAADRHGPAAAVASPAQLAGRAVCPHRQRQQQQQQQQACGGHRRVCWLPCKGQQQLRWRHWAGHRDAAGESLGSSIGRRVSVCAGQLCWFGCSCWC